MRAILYILLGPVFWFLLGLTPVYGQDSQEMNQVNRLDVARARVLDSRQDGPDCMVIPAAIKLYSS